MKKSLVALTLSLLAHNLYANEAQNRAEEKRIERESWVKAMDKNGNVMIGHLSNVTLDGEGGFLHFESAITENGIVISEHIEPPVDKTESSEKADNKKKVKNKFWANTSAQVSNFQGKKGENMYVTGYHEYVVENQTSYDRKYWVKVTLCLTVLSTHCFTGGGDFWVAANSYRVGTANSLLPVFIDYAGNYQLIATTEITGPESSSSTSKATVYIR